MRSIIRTLMIALIASVSVGCAVKKGTINSYVEPTYQQGSIKKVAVFSIRNASVAPSQARDINVRLIKAIVDKNSDVAIVSPANALKAINEAGLASKWADFVEDYYTSGIANKEILTEISRALEVDAIMQGQLVNVQQRDGDGWVTTGSTRVTVSFSIVQASTAKEIWSAAADGVSIRAADLDAPPIAEAIDLALDKVIQNIPSL